MYEAVPTSTLSGTLCCSWPQCCSAWHSKRCRACTSQTRTTSLPASPRSTPAAWRSVCMCTHTSVLYAYMCVHVYVCVVCACMYSTYLCALGDNTLYVHSQQYLHTLPTTQRLPSNLTYTTTTHLRASCGAHQALAMRSEFRRRGF